MSAIKYLNQYCMWEKVQANDQIGEDRDSNEFEEDKFLQNRIYRKKHKLEINKINILRYF